MQHTSTAGGRMEYPEHGKGHCLWHMSCVWGQVRGNAHQGLLHPWGLGKGMRQVRKLLGAKKPVVCMKGGAEGCRRGVWPVLQAVYSVQGWGSWADRVCKGTGQGGKNENTRGKGGRIKTQGLIEGLAYLGKGPKTVLAKNK